MLHRVVGSRRRRLSVTFLLGAGLILTLLTLPACTGKTERPPTAPPPPTFTGPAYLHGTVGSMARLQGFEPILVSGYGLVVDLQGTGSSEVPARLRQRLINEMARRGAGSAIHGGREYTPARLLDSMNTAVVAVEGLIPPGATRGMRFDVLVSALPQTQTTSLANGRLWTVELAVDGLSLDFRRPFGAAHGPIYLPPISADVTGRQRYDQARQALIVAGGVVNRDAPLQLVLNQPSWSRSRQIADRINEKFRRGPGDVVDTANAKTDLIIELSIPRRFAYQPQRLLGLIQYLYVQRGFNFEEEQARRLVNVLVQDVTQANAVTHAWEALGRTILPVIRPYYEHENLSVRLAAIEAGAHLGDALVVEHLRHVAGLPDPAVRRHAAALVASLPSDLSAMEVVRRLLNDPEQAVRLQAYDSLSRINDPNLLQRVAMGKGTDEDFLLDVVDVQRPMLLVTHQDRPRVVVFNGYLGFKTPLIANLLDGQLLLKAMAPQQPVEVYYRGPQDAEGREFKLAPTVANLVFLLGHAPNAVDPTPGLGLPFGSVVQILKDLHDQGRLEQPLLLQQSELARQITSAREREGRPERPELGEITGPNEGAARPDADADATAPAPAPNDSVNNDRSGLKALPTP